MALDNNKARKYGAATPNDIAMIELLGGNRHEGIVLSRSQMNHLRKAYEFNPIFPAKCADQAVALREAEIVRIKAENAEKAAKGLTRNSYNGLKDVPNPLTGAEKKTVERFHQAGDDRDLLRQASGDGLRVMAFLAQFLEPGQDPVKLVVQLCADAGYDTAGCGFEEGFDEDFDDEEDAE